MAVKKKGNYIGEFLASIMSSPGEHDVSALSS